MHVYFVPMVPDLERLLRAIEAEQVARWGKPSRFVFPNATNTGPDNGDTFVRTVFRPALLRAGIDRETITPETVRVRAGKATVKSRSRPATSSIRFAGRIYGTHSRPGCGRKGSASTVSARSLATVQTAP